MAQEDERIRELTTGLLHLTRAVISIRGVIMEIMESPAISAEQRAAANQPLMESFQHIKELLEVVKSINRRHGGSDG